MKNHFDRISISISTKSQIITVVLTAAYCKDIVTITKSLIKTKDPLSDGQKELSHKYSV